MQNPLESLKRKISEFQSNPRKMSKTGEPNEEGYVNRNGNEGGHGTGKEVR